MKKHLLILCLMTFAWNAKSQTSINIYHAKDSLFSLGCPTTLPYFEEFNLFANVTGYSLNDTFLIKAYMGDGGVVSYYDTPWMYNGIMTVGGWGGIQYYYLSWGTYDVTYIIVGPDGNADTVIKYDEIIMSTACSQFTYRSFIDLNNNCVFEPATEVLAGNVAIELLNGNSSYVNLYPTWTTLSLPTGINYTAKVDAAAFSQLGYSLTCVSSGMFNFTTTPGSSDTAWFPLQCNPNFDLSVVAANSYFRYGNTSYMWLDINNVACSPTTGTYSLTLDPNLNFLASLTPPNSNSGQSYFYNFSNLFTLGNGSGSLNNLIAVNIDPSVPVGDSLCYQVSVIPTANDVNPQNNYMHKCDLVYNSWDPNAKTVSPKGNGVNGEIPSGTRLTYTIMFQNTGNDTAYKVVLRDTLDADLDINSMRIRGASHPFNFYIYNGNVIEFEFRNIMLPDSGTNQLLSNGMVMFEIDHKDGLPLGTQLRNKAGIYFDANPAVVTNEVINTLAQPLLVSNVFESKFSISPNPASNFLQITFDKNIDGKISVLNQLGQVINAELIQSNKAAIDVSKLVTGIYFIRLNTASGNVTKKFSKL
jgi:uncharacterized repeat protein (TIGR01451 family)